MAYLRLAKDNFVSHVGLNDIIFSSKNKQSVYPLKGHSRPTSHLKIIRMGITIFTLPFRHPSGCCSNFELWRKPSSKLVSVAELVNLIRLSKCIVNQNQNSLLLAVQGIEFIYFQWLITNSINSLSAISSNSRLDIFKQCYVTAHPCLSLSALD